MAYACNLGNGWELTCDSLNWVLKKGNSKNYYSNLRSALLSIPDVMLRKDSSEIKTTSWHKLIDQFTLYSDNITKIFGENVEPKDVFEWKEEETD